MCQPADPIVNIEDFHYFESMQVVLILKSNNLDPWLLDWSQINLCKQGKITLKAKWNQDLPIFLPAPSKHRWISLRVTASHKFGHDFLKYLKPLQTDSSANSLGNAWHWPPEAKLKLKWAIFGVDFANFVAGSKENSIRQKFRQITNFRFWWLWRKILESTWIKKF